MRIARLIAIIGTIAIITDGPGSVLLVEESMRSISSYGDDEGDRWPHKRSDKIVLTHVARWGRKATMWRSTRTCLRFNAPGSESLGVTEMATTFQSGMPSCGAFITPDRTVRPRFSISRMQPRISL
jgi:hypothetical protein